MGEVLYVRSRSASSTCRHNANGEPIDDRIVLSSPVHFVPRDLTALLTIHVQVPRWLSEYHRSGVLGSEAPSDIPEVGSLDAYSSGVESESDRNLSNLTCGPDFGQFSQLSFESYV